MTPEIRRRLVEAALEVRTRAYAKYSQFRVGAALLTESGEIVVGCNVENASYGMTICAERAAIFTAVSQGHQRFLEIAIATASAHAPCGACRQVLAEFCDDLLVLLVNADQPDQIYEASLRELLPGKFELPE